MLVEPYLPEVESVRFDSLQKISSACKNNWSLPNILEGKFATLKQKIQSWSKQAEGTVSTRTKNAVAKLSLFLGQ